MTTKNSRNRKPDPDRRLATLAAAMIVLTSLNLKLVFELDSHKPLQIPPEVERLLTTSNE